MTPWVDTPYQDQLRRKEEELKKVLKDMAYRIAHEKYCPVSYVRVTSM